VTPASEIESLSSRWPAVPERLRTVPATFKRRQLLEASSLWIIRVLLANGFGSHGCDATPQSDLGRVSRTHCQRRRCGAVQKVRAGASRSEFGCRPQTTASCCR
jgi:hypothetical protein